MNFRVSGLFVSACPSPSALALAHSSCSSFAPLAASRPCPSLPPLPFPGPPLALCFHPSSLYFSLPLSPLSLVPALSRLLPSLALPPIPAPSFARPRPYLRPSSALSRSPPSSLLTRCFPPSSPSCGFLPFRWALSVSRGTLDGASVVEGMRCRGVSPCRMFHVKHSWRGGCSGGGRGGFPYTGRLKRRDSL